MLDATFRPATPADLDQLARLMRGLYEHDRLPFDEQSSRRVTRQLLDDETRGRVWLIELAGATAGYLVLTYGFSLEYHGRDALLDEFFLHTEFRGRGLGRRALEFVAAHCRAEGISAVHLVVDHANERAQRVYRQFGFAVQERFLMTKWLDKED
ncbi:MAG TPA: GNAT family N-acetyltransferase [Pyrinomonadaceae bacterium]|nr:GNAT family N-acetyltransferase [Pyrinomonadaceae bacterium]